MIDLFFRLGGEYILVKISGHNVRFGNTTYGKYLTDISGLKLSKSGVIKEFPDLEDKKDWNKIAIERFKDHIKSLGTERKIAEYIITDLIKHGYIPLKMQEAGRRIVDIGSKYGFN